MLRISVSFVLFATAVFAGNGNGDPSRGLAVLASAAVPGTGQMMLGTRNRGEALLWVDSAIWTTWAGFSWLGRAREQDARLSAARESGADISIADPGYYKALERYDNVDEYNEDIRRQARDRYPDDPEAQHDYYEENGYFGEMGWDWSSDSARFDYWRTRKAARAATLKAGFAVGALVLNRLVSVVDCAFFARAPSEWSRIEFGTGSRFASLELRYRF